MAAKTDGFSLIELLIVIVIIGILVIVAVPNMLRSKRTAEAAAAVNTLRSIGSAQELLYSRSNHRMYGDFSQLSGNGYLDDRFATDPVSFSSYVFEMTTDGHRFTCWARPVAGVENDAYYINSTMVIFREDGTPYGS